MELGRNISVRTWRMRIRLILKQQQKGLKIILPNILKTDMRDLKSLENKYKMDKKEDVILKRLLKILFLLMIGIPLCLILIRIGQYAASAHKNAATAKIAARYQLPLLEEYEISALPINKEDFIDIAGLKTENPDTVGYVRIEGTPVDYPVLKNEKNQDKYLRAGFDGEYSVSGSIFMDNACYEGCMNTVLYGHNMKSGDMFSVLKNYTDSEFTQNHNIIKYVDENAISVYKVCAVFSAPAGDKELIHCLIPYTKEEMEALKECISSAGGAVYEDFGFGDKLITLATCEYTHKNGRLFVVGKLDGSVEFKRGDNSHQ